MFIKIVNYWIPYPKKVVINLSVLFFHFSLISQLNFEPAIGFPVTIGTDTLSLAFNGGLNLPQFSSIDFDFDGDDDLFLFDRSADKIILFANNWQNGQPTYVYVDKPEQYFPNDLRYRVACIDYNGDGKKDLFCYGIGGIKVYKNVGNSINGLQWQVAKNLIYSDYAGTNLNLYISSADIPAIEDIDKDGDYDILTYSLSGDHVEYHKNLGIEEYGTSDSLKYKLMNRCWGKFREDLNTNGLFLNDTSSICSTSNVTNAEFPEFKDLGNKKPFSLESKHSGSTLLAIDMDNSGVMDLLIGDISFPNINLLINGGTSTNQNSAMVSIQSNFPANSSPVDVDYFPASFWIDTDFDSKKDLLVSPNAKNISFNTNSVFRYKNVGSNVQPIFSYQESDFLQGEMIDVGSGSIPSFCDINGDGLMDLFVANFYKYERPNTKKIYLSYFRNVGTSTAPSFKLIDNDFLSINTLGLGLRTVPTFGDIDSDGDFDLVIGLENGTLRIMTNIGSSTTPQFSSPIVLNDSQSSPINVGSYAFPQLFDLNRDQKLDLIIGKKNGEIAYYENIGTPTSPLFAETNGILGSLDIATTTPDGYAAPHFFNLHDTTFLLVGSTNGKLALYENVYTNNTIQDSFLLTNTSFLNFSSGALSTNFITDIDNDSLLDLFIGGELGGLNHYEVDVNSSANVVSMDDRLWVIYPNPCSTNLYISTGESSDMVLTIYNETGQKIRCEKLSQANTSINLEYLSNGCYVIELKQGEDFISTKRMVVIH